MSWTAHSTTNNGLVDNLMSHGILKTPQIANAMKSVDRHHFVADPHVAYLDAPSPIGYGATISAPHMHAYALELLKDNLKPGYKVLDVGSGSGYLAAVFAKLVTADSQRGKVIGIEHIPQLVEQSKSNLKRQADLSKLQEEGLLTLMEGDGWKGYRAEAPYNAIHVGAAAARIPKDLVDQLALGGRLVVPIGPEGGPQVLSVIDKDKDGSLSRRDAMQVAYVPLTSREHQLRSGG